jgi:hypothetical protein
MKGRESDCTRQGLSRLVSALDVCMPRRRVRENVLLVAFCPERLLFGGGVVLYGGRSNEPASDITRPTPREDFLNLKPLWYVSPLSPKFPRQARPPVAAIIINFVESISHLMSQSRAQLSDQVLK